jgi:hypothetical protein
MLFHVNERALAIKDTAEKIRKAYQEDEAIRKASEQNSKLYLKEIDDEDDRTPLWCLCGIWFCLGILFTVVYTNFDWMGIIKELIT